MSRTSGIFVALGGGGWDDGEVQREIGRVDGGRRGELLEGGLAGYSGGTSMVHRRYK